MSQEPTKFDRVGVVARFVLLAAIAVVAALILTAPRADIGLGQPYLMRSAVADGGGAGGVAAAPGYLLLTMGVTLPDKFYVVDTNKQVICVYSVVGDKLRLLAARKFDVDANIPDGSVRVLCADNKERILEAGNGLNREESKLYGDAIQKSLEAAEKKK